MRPATDHKCAGPAGIWLAIDRKHHPLGPCYVSVWDS